MIPPPSTMEITAVSTFITKGLGLTAVTLAVLLIGYGVQAQAPATKEAAPKAAPAKKQAACKTVKGQATCEGRTDCQWVGESMDAKGKVKAKAYCRTKASK
jgi:hypothetical protein